jgi:hypothetical protein
MKTIEELNSQGCNIRLIYENEFISLLNAQSNNEPIDNRINSVAENLALMFSDESDIPIRFKTKKEEKTKLNLNSMIELRFKRNTNSWKTFIELILSKVEREKAWRFITLTPNIEEGINSVTFCQDFIDFTDFFILRRDVENCSDNELGQLAMLHTAFQWKIENILEYQQHASVSN